MSTDRWNAIKRTWRYLKPIGENASQRHLLLHTNLLPRAYPDLQGHWWADAAQQCHATTTHELAKEVCVASQFMLTLQTFQPIPNPCTPRARSTQLDSQALLAEKRSSISSLKSKYEVPSVRSLFLWAIKFWKIGIPAGDLCAVAAWPEHAAMRCCRDRSKIGMECMWNLSKHADYPSLGRPAR